MSEALDLYSFMSSLPDALIASQKREAQRLEKLKGEKGPRVEALKVSMEQAAQLNATARWGRARVDRAMATALEPNDVFHGFVSGSDLQVRKGYTVRLVGADGKQRHSAVTQADGYFTMTLAAKQKGNPFAGKDETQSVLLAEMLQLFGMRGAPASDPVKAPASSLKKGSAAKEKGEEAESASVEIVDASGQVVQQDPIPVDLKGGTVYREYLVGGKTGESAPQRYIGNSAKHELHDSEKAKKQCNLEAMSESHKVYFASTEAAEKAGYDYCAHCFGKARSKR
jgi:hypothetical protein